MSNTAYAMRVLQMKFNPSAAAGLDLVLGFHVTDEDKHCALLVKDGTCQLQELSELFPS